MTKEVEILRNALDGAKNEMEMFLHQKSRDSETKIFCSTNISCIVNAIEEADKIRDGLDSEMVIADKVKNSKVGDFLIFEYPQHGRDFDQKLARKYLKKGEKYTIERIEIRHWSTDIFLEEIPGQCFNSVQFKAVS